MPRKYKKRGGATADSNIPFDTQYHTDLSKKQMQAHIDEIEDNIKSNAILLKEANERVKKQIMHENKRKENEEAIRLKNQAQYDLLKEKKFQHRFNSIFSFLGFLWGNLTGVLKELFRKLWDFGRDTIGVFVKIISIETIISIIAYILLIIFIASFIFGYAINMPVTSLQMPSFLSSTSLNMNASQKVSDIYNFADEKVKYVQSQNILDQIKNFFTNIPLYFSNAFIILKNFFMRLNRLSGNDNYQLFTKDRIINNAGRWDNIYNMELGKLISDFENIKNDDNIYSILKPSPLELHLSATANKDLNGLPSVIQNDIKKDKDVLKFNWELDRQSEASGLIKYKMQCNPKDAKNETVNLFKEFDRNNCIINEIPYIHENETSDNKPKYYDKEVRRYDKSLSLDIYVS